jgi:hypothetical protein
MGIIVGREAEVATDPLMTTLVPSAPVSPLGIVKFKTAADVVPEFETVAEVPATPVVVVPTATVAAVPVAPTSPLGTVKLKTAADVVPEFETAAEVPAAPVVVVPTATVAASPVTPFKEATHAASEKA